MEDEVKKVIIRMPKRFHEHIRKVSVERNIGIRQFMIEALRKELVAINREYATPEDLKYRKFENKK
ncbi:TPA: hypothetical protein QDB51_002692 [Burkholderia vietnamiensis]|uniref:hypothetical protein n=1 Tax=Ralstonia insidiosa TaxID=190721 RepID=UPI000ABA261F|nr:hypothetical protein [Ralstonia insidiosa]HDR9188617.1 hypothetical protein [Burkholderia vietnamiensis]